MKDQNKVRAIAKSLNKSFYHHGYPLGRKEAKEIGLSVVEQRGGGSFNVANMAKCGRGDGV